MKWEPNPVLSTQYSAKPSGEGALIGALMPAHSSCLQVTVTGWGSTREDDDQVSDVLQEVSPSELKGFVRIVSCLIAPQKWPTSWMINIKQAALVAHTRKTFPK